MRGVVTLNFDEDVTGVDISDLSLTLAGNTVDISGLDLTQVSPSQYTIDLSTVTTTEGTYELTLNSSNSGIEDLAGNALDTDAMDQFMIDMTGPQVESVVINGGDINGDRSVNIVDFFQFRNAFRGNYNAAFDFNGDGNINIVDFFQFRIRFGQTL